MSLAIVDDKLPASSVGADPSVAGRDRAEHVAVASALRPGRRRRPDRADRRAPLHALMSGRDEDAVDDLADKRSSLDGIERRPALAGLGVAGESLDVDSPS